MVSGEPAGARRRRPHHLAAHPGVLDAAGRGGRPVPGVGALGRLRCGGAGPRCLADGRPLPAGGHLGPLVLVVVVRQRRPHGRHPGRTGHGRGHRRLGVRPDRAHLPTVAAGDGPSAGGGLRPGVGGGGAAGAVRRVLGRRRAGRRQGAAGPGRLVPGLAGRLLVLVPVPSGRAHAAALPAPAAQAGGQRLPHRLRAPGAGGGAGGDDALHGPGRCPGQPRPGHPRILARDDRRGQRPGAGPLRHHLHLARRPPRPRPARWASPPPPGCPTWPAAWPPPPATRPPPPRGTPPPGSPPAATSG